MSKQSDKQKKIQGLKRRILVTNILFVVDLAVVLLTALFGDSDMTPVWIVFLFVAAGFFLLSRSARKELDQLEPDRVKAAGASRSLKKHR